MHYNEWIKKYSPLNMIYTVTDLAALLKISNGIFYYKISNGYLLKEQKKPELYLPESE